MKEVDFEYDSKVISLGRNAIGILRKKCRQENQVSIVDIVWQLLYLANAFVLTKHKYPEGLRKGSFLNKQSFIACKYFHTSPILSSPSKKQHNIVEKKEDKTLPWWKLSVLLVYVTLKI